MTNQVTTLRMGQKFKKTLAGDIPVDWDIRKVCDVCEISPSKIEVAQVSPDTIVSFIRMENVHENAGGISATKDVRLGDVVGGGYTYFKEGDLLFAKITPCMENGKIALAKALKNGIGFGSTEFHVLRVDPAKVSSEFLFYWISRESFREFASRHFRGTAGQQRVQRDFFDIAHIPVPPQREQKKIAEILSSVDDAIEKTNAVINRKQTLKNGLAQQLFTRGAHAHRKFKTTDIGCLPEGWDLRPCDQVCDMVTVGIVIQPARLYVETGVPCFRSLNIHEESISTDNLVFISPEANEAHEKSKLKAGDVVAVRTGYPGTACVIPDIYDGANCVDLIILRPGKSILGHFLSRFINSPEGRKQIERTQGGLAQQHFNIGEAAKMLVPLPTLPEQQQIVEVFQSIENQIQVQEQHCRRLECLKKGLMMQLLTGQIRV